MLSLNSRDRWNSAIESQGLVLFVAFRSVQERFCQMFARKSIMEIWNSVGHCWQCIPSGENSRMRKIGNMVSSVMLSWVWGSCSELSQLRITSLEALYRVFQNLVSFPTFCKNRWKQLRLVREARKWTFSF